MTRTHFPAALGELRAQLAAAGIRADLNAHPSSNGDIYWVDLTGRDVARTSVHQLVWSSRSGWFAVGGDNVPRPLDCDESTKPRVFAQIVMRIIRS